MMALNGIQKEDTHIHTSRNMEGGIFPVTKSPPQRTVSDPVVYKLCIAKSAHDFGLVPRNTYTNPSNRTGENISWIRL